VVSHECSPDSTLLLDAGIRRLSPLTHRELQVLQLLSEGASNSTISSRLTISPTTAKNHLAAIYRKLGVANRTQALMRAISMGMIDLDGETSKFQIESGDPI
jgi:ATP/maltotriose-dependent transcriptional regulator MalT